MPIEAAPRAWRAEAVSVLQLGPAIPLDQLRLWTGAWTRSLWPPLWTLSWASGDGGFLMGLSDLESLIGAARSAIVIYNDAAYGAEKPRLIPKVDFSGVAHALGAESAVIRSISTLPR